MSERIYTDKLYDPYSQPIEHFERENEKLIDRAEEELVELEPSFREVVEKIESLKPDKIVFLDKSARLFGTPLMKVLRDRNDRDDWSPTIDFFNDENLKVNTLVENGHGVSSDVSAYFDSMSGQRVFFVDETTSSGRGAHALKEACERHGVDGYYFALTHNPGGDVTTQSLVEQLMTSDGISEEEAKERVLKMQKLLQDDPNFTWGSVPLETVFTKIASQLYITEEDETTNPKTAFRYKPVTDEDVEAAYNYTDEFSAIFKDVPGKTYNHHRTGENPPEPFESWKDYDQAVRKLNMQTVRILKNMIRAAIERSLVEESESVQNNIEQAYKMFEKFGLVADEQGLLHGEMSLEQLEALSLWRQKNMDGGIEMTTPEIFDQKALLAVSLWRQREGEKVNYLLGKGAGVEVALRGQAVGRQKRDVEFQYRTHSDFELYGVEYDQEGDITGRNIGTEKFWKVFGGQEYYPTTRTKGLFKLPPNLLHETAQSIKFGDIEVLVPELELLFLDKLAKPESTPRTEGNDVELLAMTYDLDPEKLHEYAEEYIVKPALEQIDQDVESITSNQITAITNNLVAKRKRLLAEDRTVDKATVVSELNADFAYAPQGLGMKMMGLHSNYYASLTPDIVDDDLAVIDHEYIDALSDRVKTSVQEQIEACSSIHKRIDQVLKRAESYQKNEIV